MYSALAASPAVEGAVVCGTYNLMRTVAGGPPGSPRAAVGGVAIGRFGWMNTAGNVSNARTSAQDIRGLVLPFTIPFCDWRAVYFDTVSNTWRIREGLQLSMLLQGNVWARFPDGAYVGQPVYARILDGAPVSGNTPGCELTPWSVVTNARAGELAVISTWSTIQ